MQRVSRLLLAALFIAAGAAHFIAPAPFLAITPPVLPAPAVLVFISGIAEIAGGVGLLLPFTRKAAALGLIALLVAVFPANIYAAIHGMHIGGDAVPQWLLWLRLPLQPLLIAWVYFAGWKARQAPR
ncbi:MAG TPA: DoxX family protein [Chthoniobacterales bacterium]